MHRRLWDGFESDVVLEGTQTVFGKVGVVVPFESDVVLEGTQTAVSSDNPD